ncbi:MAG TPA: efflux RND transporter periplasmic adaptor subunit [Burkholderiaceae bacterium]
MDNADPPNSHPTPAPLLPSPRPASRRSKLIGSAIAVLVLAGLGALAWYLARPDTSTEGTGRRGPPASTVGVANVEKIDIPITLEALGTVTPTATVRVQAQVTGVLKELQFREGQMVKAGQLLATIDPRTFEMALLQATGQRQRDEAQLDNARLTLQRYRTLLEQDSIARQEVDTQAALVKQLEGTLNTDRANEGTARINLGYTRVVAPISGRVGLRVVDVGNVVGPGDANGLALITQVSPIDVEFAVPQDQVSQLLQESGAGPGLAATALDRTRATVLETGRFLSLDNQVDVQTGTVRAKARFANTAGTLFPSQFVNLRLVVRTIRDATVVPLTAVRLGGSGDYVFVLNADRTVSTRPVKRGHATADKVVIVSGLQPGERVITEGADRLKDGARVALPGDAPAAGGTTGRRRGASAAGAASAPASSTSAPRPAAAAASAP